MSKRKYTGLDDDVEVSDDAAVSADEPDDDAGNPDDDLRDFIAPSDEEEEEESQRLSDDSGPRASQTEEVIEDVDPNSQPGSGSQAQERMREAFSQEPEEKKDEDRGFERLFVNTRNPASWENMSRETLEDLRSSFMSRCLAALQPPDIGPNMIRLFGLEEHQLTFENLYSTVRCNYHRAILDLHILYNSRRWLNGPDGDELKASFTKLHAFVELGIEILISHIKVKNFVDLGEYLPPNTYQLTSMNLGDISPMHRCILYLLNTLQASELKKYRDTCVEEIVVYNIQCPDGTRELRSFPSTKVTLREGEVKIAVFKTQSWTEHAAIADFTYKNISASKNFNRWNDLCISAYESVANYLKLCNEGQFPGVIPKREMRSFLNGMLDITMDDVRFLSFLKERAAVPRLGYRDGRQEVCCKHFEATFDPCILNQTHWYHIPTPYFDRVLDDQKLAECVKRMVYVMFGRLLYALHQHDKFGVILFIIGVASTGKTTLGEVAKKFFQATDVASLSSNIEELFGLAAIRDKLLMICNEVTKQWKLSRGDTQSIITGDDISTAAKNKNPVNGKWGVPGLLFGNEFGPWFDSAMSMFRRILCLQFLYEIKVDETMEKKLDGEISVLLFKCQQAYATFLHEEEGKSFWHKVPKYFLHKREEFSLEMNPVKEFLMRSELVHYDPENPELCMSRKAFMTLLHNYLQTTSVHRLSTAQIDESLRNLKITDRIMQVNGFSGTWLFGVAELKNDMPANHNNTDAEKLGQQADDERNFLSALPAPRADPMISGRRHLRAF